jgi:hypothetical protein
MTYSLISLSLSILAVVLATLYCRGVVEAYQIYHDERAAVSLAKAVGLWVVALGLAISSTGSLLGQMNVDFEHAELARVGLSLSRGALLALLLTLVMAGVRPGHRS